MIVVSMSVIVMITVVSAAHLNLESLKLRLSQLHLGSHQVLDDFIMVQLHELALRHGQPLSHHALCPPCTQHVHSQTGLGHMVVTHPMQTLQDRRLVACLA